MTLETKDLSFILFLEELVLMFEVLELGEHGVELGGLFVDLSTPLCADVLVASVFGVNAVIFLLEHVDKLGEPGRSGHDGGRGGGEGGEGGRRIRATCDGVGEGQVIVR